MNDPYAEYSEPDSPFESTSEEPHPDPEPERKAFDLWGLRNSTPAVTPSEVGYQLDLTANWWDHVFCGMLKQSHSDAAEAWQHYVIAGIILADKQYGFLTDEDREAIEEAEDWGDMDDGR